MYNQIKLDNNLWFKDIKALFQSVNALNVLERHVPSLMQNNFTSMLRVNYYQTLRSTGLLRWKLHYYKAIKNDCITGNYCLVNLKWSQRSSIAKLRLGMLPINVELGQYLRKPREECLLCTLCDQT